MVAKPKAKPKSKMKGSFAGIYVWTQRDFNNLMSQIAAIGAQLTASQTQLTSMSKTLNVVASTVAVLQTQEVKEMSALDDLKAAVTQTQTVEQSAVTLLQGIAQKLNEAMANNQAASNDPALTSLRDQLNTSAAELAAAITANTPAEGDGGASGA
jgi:hypothetical protein